MAEEVDEWNANRGMKISISEQAQRDLSDEAFLKDVRLFTRGEHGLAVFCRYVANRCLGLKKRDLPELIEHLPSEYHKPVKMLVERREDKPEEPPADAIESVLLQCWHDEWKSQIKAELESLSHQDEFASSTDSATQK